MDILKGGAWRLLRPATGLIGSLTGYQAAGGAAIAVAGAARTRASDALMISEYDNMSLIIAISHARFTRRRAAPPTQPMRGPSRRQLMFWTRRNASDPGRFPIPRMTPFAGQAIRREGEAASARRLCWTARLALTDQSPNA